MNLPKIEELDVEGKIILLRCDLDVPLVDGNIKDDSRLVKSLPSIFELRERRASKIVLLGKLGRPKGQKDDSLSTRLLISWYTKKLNQSVRFVGFRLPADLQTAVGEVRNSGEQIIMFDNLRFWKEEIDNDEEFGKKLSDMGDAYVNDSFGMSHREQASVMYPPKYLPKAAGVQFLAEVENLSKVINSPERPVIVIISGAKKDKLDYLDDFREFADHIYVGGLLPKYFKESFNDEKITVLKLSQDGEDLTIRSIEKVEEAVAVAGTIVLSGPLGHFESPGHRLGTERVFTAVANSDAFKVTGGGDSTSVVNELSLAGKFDWVSTGGGAMLEFLARGTLPGIIALTE